MKFLASHTIYLSSSCFFLQLGGDRFHLMSPLGVFSGNLSTDMREGSKWNINRSGFCGMRSKKVKIIGFVFLY